MVVLGLRGEESEGYGQLQVLGHPAGCQVRYGGVSFAVCPSVGGEEGGADFACPDEPDAERPDGPVQPINPDVPVEGPALLEGFEWVTVDLTDDAQVCFACPAFDALG